MMNILEYIGDIFQWDSGLSLTVNGQLIDEAGTQYVHYQHKGKSAVYSVAVTDGMAAIPNELLQVPGAFNAYAYVLDESNGKTLVCREFRIVPRPQPPEYIYDPTPVITYPELVELVEDLNALKEEISGPLDFVNNHFTETPTSVIFGNDDSDDIKIAARRNVILSPGEADDGSLYKGEAEDDNELMTSAAVQRAISQAIFSYLFKAGGTPAYPLGATLEVSLKLPDARHDHARIRFYINDNVTGESGEGFIRTGGDDKLIVDDGFDLQTSVLLWSNPNQAAGMENDTTVTLTLPRAGAQTFKNLLVEFAMTSTSTERYTMVIPNETYTASQRRYNAVVDYSAFNAMATPRGRQIKACVKDRSLTFGSGYQAGVINDARMVPIRIFGLR